MKSKDVMAQQREELVQKFNAALKSEDPEQVAQAMADMAAGIEEEILQKAANSIAVEQMDAQALAARGLRQLTSEEKKYYEKLITAMKSDDPKQALTNLDVTMPKTIIEDVFEDLRKEHPLLNAINFQNTSYMTEFIINKNGKQKAVWGKVTEEITKELEGSFENVNMLMYILTAFMPVAKSMLDLGATWLDSYVREVLKDAIYCGLEEGIVTGTGVDQPIGMMKDISAAHKDGEEYPDKEAIPVSSFDPVTYGGIIAKLAVGRNGRHRAVTRVLMIVNPVDYFTKVMPATTIMRPDGTYANDVLPFPTEIVQCEEMPQNKAVVGIAEKYFMGIGSSKDGAIEYSDEFRFLKRERVYAAFLYGNGKPTDNNAFEVLDISELQPAAYTVKTMNGAPANDTHAVTVATYSADIEVGGDANKTYTEEELNALSIEKIKEIAAAKGITITKTKKAEIVAEFLAAQEG